MQKRHKYAVRRSDATGSFSEGADPDLLCINRCIRIAARHTVTSFSVFRILADTTVKLCQQKYRKRIINEYSWTLLQFLIYKILKLYNIHNILIINCKIIVCISKIVSFIHYLQIRGLVIKERYDLSFGNVRKNLKN